MKLILFLAISFSAAGSFAQTKSLGLFPSKKIYSLSEYQNLGLVEFQSSRPGQLAPLAFQIQLNGISIRNATDILSEKMYAGLPKGFPIQILSGGVWAFPIGTIVVHELRFKDKNQSLFEVRMIEKLDPHNWGYGTYTLDGSDLKLRSHSESEQKDITLRSPEDLAWNISLQTVPQKVCARCHTGRSLNELPIEAFEQTGPCEFQPQNPNLVSTWADTFFSRNGWKPFTK